jgi:sugar-specific transcriptional regulator TrmB
MDQELLKLMESTGFTEKESRVYLALLELGPCDVTAIANRAELKRSIIYVIIEGLVKRGYVSELPNTKINTYQAGDPTIILNQLKVTAKNFSQMLPILHTLGSQERPSPKSFIIQLAKAFGILTRR